MFLVSACVVVDAVKERSTKEAGSRSQGCSRKNFGFRLGADSLASLKSARRGGDRNLAHSLPTSPAAPAR